MCLMCCDWRHSSASNVQRCFPREDFPDFDTLVNYKSSPRFKAYLSRDEAQDKIARILAEKDTLRCQLVELQEKVFSLQAKRSRREDQPSSDVMSRTDTVSHTQASRVARVT